MFTPRLCRWNHDALICSCGGVATTMFIKLVQRFLRTNDPYDQDGLKHLPRPPVSLPSSIRVVYLYGDPVAVVASLFRRGYANVQAHKLGHYFPARCNDVAAYAARGRDTLGITRQLRLWLKECGPARSYPVLAIRYRAIWTETERILSFLQLPATAADSLPPYRKWRSKDELPSKVVRNLESIYAQAYATINSMPDVTIV